MTSKCVARGANSPLNTYLNEQLLQQKNPEQNFESGRIPKSIQQYIQSGLRYRKLSEGMQNYCRRLLNLMLFKMPLGSETERFKTCKVCLSTWNCSISMTNKTPIAHYSKHKIPLRGQLTFWLEVPIREMCLGIYNTGGNTELAIDLGFCSQLHGWLASSLSMQCFWALDP